MFYGFPCTRFIRDEILLHEIGRDKTSRQTTVLPAQPYHHSTRPPCPPFLRGGDNTRLRLGQTGVAGKHLIGGRAAGLARGLARPQQIRENQQVFILLVTPGAVPDEQTRRAAAARIERTLDAAERHAAERGITAQEADAAVAEAMEQVRPRHF